MPQTCWSLRWNSTLLWNRASHFLALVSTILIVSRKLDDTVNFSNHETIWCNSCFCHCHLLLSNSETTIQIKNTYGVHQMSTEKRISSVHSVTMTDGCFKMERPIPCLPKLQHAFFVTIPCVNVCVCLWIVWTIGRTRVCIRTTSHHV